MGAVAAVYETWQLSIMHPVFISLALPMTEFEAQKCSVRNVFWDENEYLVAWQHKH